MQYAIVSDIHANLQAWNAVLLDIRSLDIDKIVCLGDIVGYGPNPSEVLKSVHANVDHLVLGNHDAVICNKISSSHFNTHAREIIMWTKKQLNNKAIEFLETLPLSLRSSMFRCAHGDFSNPAAFLYTIEPEDAAPSWEMVDQQLLFTGHTHEPAIFLLGPSGIPRVVEPQDFQMEDDKRFLVNVGSVGQPRDMQARSCYCILDIETKTVSWRNIPFDLDAYQDSVIKAGISLEASPFLNFDPRHDKQPLRDLMDFSPGTASSAMMQNTIEVCEIDQLKRKVTSLKIRTFAMLCGIAVLSLGAGITWNKTQARSTEIRPRVMMAIETQAIPTERNILTEPLFTIKEGESVPGWSIHLGESRKQSVGVEIDTQGKPCFILSSGSTEQIVLSSPELSARPGTKFTMEVMIKKTESFSGSIAAVVSLQKKNSRIDQYIVKEPNLLRKNDWMLAKQTFTCPAETKSIVFSMRGTFQGKAYIQPPKLVRRK